MYQKIGVNYEIITDFDVLRVPAEFNRFLSLMPLEEKKHHQLLNQADQLREIINRSVNTDGLSEEEKKQEEKRKRNDVYHKQGIRFF